MGVFTDSNEHWEGSSAAVQRSEVEWDRRRPSLAVRRLAGPSSLLRLVSAGLAGLGPVGGQGRDQVQVWSCRE